MRASFTLNTIWLNVEAYVIMYSYIQIKRRETATVSIVIGPRIVSRVALDRQARQKDLTGA